MIELNWTWCGENNDIKAPDYDQVLALLNQLDERITARDKDGE